MSKILIRLNEEPVIFSSADHTVILSPGVAKLLLAIAALSGETVANPPSVPYSTQLTASNIIERVSQVTEKVFKAIDESL